MWTIEQCSWTIARMTDATNHKVNHTSHLIAGINGHYSSVYGTLEVSRSAVTVTAPSTNQASENQYGKTYLMCGVNEGGFYADKWFRYFNNAMASNFQSDLCLCWLLKTHKIIVQENSLLSSLRVTQNDIVAADKIFEVDLARLKVKHTLMIASK